MPVLRNYIECFEVTYIVLSDGHFETEYRKNLTQFSLVAKHLLLITIVTFNCNCVINTLEYRRKTKWSS